MSAIQETEETENKFAVPKGCVRQDIWDQPEQIAEKLEGNGKAGVIGYQVQDGGYVYLVPAVWSRRLLGGSIPLAADAEFIKLSNLQYPAMRRTELIGVMSPIDSLGATPSRLKPVFSNDPRLLRGGDRQPLFHIANMEWLRKNADKIVFLDANGDAIDMETVTPDKLVFHGAYETARKRQLSDKRQDSSAVAPNGVDFTL